MANEQKKGLSTNSNAYTLIYAAVLVVIVAFLLSAVSSVLNDKKVANQKVDQKSQILAAINVSSDDVEAAFSQYVKSDALIDANGSVISQNDGFEADFKKDASKGLPLYICEKDGETKYIIPMSGKGLWGGISGYIGLKSDKNTIDGIFFTHESETPGLGAEITADYFTKQFIGKHIKNAAGEIVSVAVLKKGNTAEGKEQVDAVTGATLTSNGVNDMLAVALEKYKNYLK